LVNGVMFSVVRHMPDNQERDYYTEFDELEGSELRFLSAMMLAVRFDEGIVAPYPASVSFAVDRDGDLLNDVFVNEIGRALPAALASTSPVYTRPLINCSRNGDGYALHHTALDLGRLDQIVTALGTEDDLMLRGLHALLKAQMLSMHAEFAEEANYGLYIALDALFALTRRRLKRSGNPDPSSTDAQACLEDLFGQPRTGSKFFEDYYDERVMTMHPENRFGVFRHAPIKHCDFHCLFEDMREAYRELALT
jgi:hypothetical protein